MENRSELRRLQSDRQYVSPEVSAICLIVLLIIAINLAITAVTVTVHWEELSLIQLIFGVSLWVVLPFLVIILMWRWSMKARWILVALFGFRAIVAAYEACAVAAISASYHSSDLFGPLVYHSVHALFYGGSATWLLLSARIRRAV